MNEQITCPRCRASLVFPDVPAGQAVQCPRCQAVFHPGGAEIQAGPPPAGPPAAGRPPARDEEEDLDSLRVGAVGRLEGDGRARAAIVLLIASLVCEGLQLIAEALYYLMLRDPAGRVIPVGRDEQIDLLVRGAACLQLVVHIPTGIVFLMWIYSASRNLAVLHAQGQSYTPGWSVGSFFIPILNLVRPYAIVQEIWKGSDPDAVGSPTQWQQSPGSGAVGLWWVSYLLSSILANISGRIALNERASQEMLETGALLGMVSNILAGVAGVVLIGLIRAIVGRQHDRLAQLSGGWPEGGDA